MRCSICENYERGVAPKQRGGKSKRDATEIVCSTCLNICIEKGFTQLPWTREEFAKPFMRRRKIPVLNRRSITNESEVTETGSD